ncbi:hypothetical protein CDAR_215061 [Caerostris darwini]|uniref:Uncharacterized protein n=1 Tax=Caerostris darwini TaxID=1538125 RepID=A0AAV4W600_9ARAC|nr:hypothetical protein CDAR_215061 [Caerostris darwini]
MQVTSGSNPPAACVAATASKKQLEESVAKDEAFHIDNKVHPDLLQRHDLLFFFLIFFFNRDVLSDDVISTAETAVSYWYTEKCGVGRVIGFYPIPQLAGRISHMVQRRRPMSIMLPSIFSEDVQEFTNVQYDALPHMQLTSSKIIEFPIVAILMADLKLLRIESLG